MNCGRPLVDLRIKNCEVGRLLLLVVVVGGRALAGCGGFGRAMAGPDSSLNMNPVNGDPIGAPDSTLPYLSATKTILGEGDLIRIPLDATLPEDFETAPRITAVLTITDGFTGEPVAADVFLYRKYQNTGAVTAVDMLPVIPCEAAHVCNLELAAFDDGKVWLVQVRVDGYEDWIVELDFATNSSRVLEIPVRLVLLKGGDVVEG